MNIWVNLTQKVGHFCCQAIVVLYLHMKEMQLMQIASTIFIKYICITQSKWTSEPTQKNELDPRKF